VRLPFSTARTAGSRNWFPLHVKIAKIRLATVVPAFGAADGSVDDHKGEELFFARYGTETVPYASTYLTAK
jgi:hypothetical protein